MLLSLDICTKTRWQNNDAGFVGIIVLVARFDISILLFLFSKNIWTISVSIDEYIEWICIVDKILHVHWI